MHELKPGVCDWTAFRETIGSDVHSHWLAGPRLLIDPMPPAEGWGDIEPAAIVLTNRHHYRHAGEFDCPVLVAELGLHEFAGDDRQVTGVPFGAEVAPGIELLEVGAICPEESALHYGEGGVLALADSVITAGGELGFVPDSLLGDDPDGVKRGIRDALRRIVAERDFDTLLLAHGEPIVGEGREQLREFVT